MVGMNTRGYLSEDDCFSLFNRKDETMDTHILTFMWNYLMNIGSVAQEEIHQFTDVKIDWKTLVKRSSTGISNAREYQMLWRHLAYREPLFENLIETEPKEDDSDLEFELEAIPPVTPEASLLAIKCLEAIMPSGRTPEEASLSKEPVHPTAVKNTMLLNSVAKKQDGTLQGSELTNLAFPSKRKRKPWTAQEENDLIAAVKKHGEGNWVNILKEDFKYDRTPSQLSQRCNIIKKRMASSKLDSDDKLNSWVLHNEQLATRKAISMALNLPMTGGLSTLSSGTRPNSSLEASKKLQSPQKTMKKSPTVCKYNRASAVAPNPLIKAAAVAAGGRIIDPSAAASLLKTTNSKNVHHIKNGNIPISKFKHTF